MGQTVMRTLTRILISLFLFIIPVSAQRVVFFGQNSKVTTVVSDLGGADFLLDMNTGTVGNSVTTTNLAAGTKGKNLGSWASVTGTGLTLGSPITACDLGSTLHVDGVAYPTGHTSKSIAIDNTAGFNYATANSPQVGLRNFSLFFCIQVGQPFVSIANNKFFDHAGVFTTGPFAIAQYQNGNCGGGANNVAGFEFHSLISTVSSTTGCIPITAGTPVKCALYGDFTLTTGNTGHLSCYDAATNVQIGSTINATMDGGGDISTAFVGNREAGTASGTTTFIQNAIVCWQGVCNSNFQPVSNTYTAPHTMSQSPSTTSTGGTGSTTIASPAIALEAHMLNAVWISTEFDSATISTVTDTAGNTYVSDPTLKLRLTGHIRGEIWYCKDTIANAGNIVTATWSTSSAIFKTITPIAIAGASLTAPLDTGASGSITAATGNPTTGSFSPANGAGVESVLICGYLDSAQSLTAGTNYFLMHTSSVTSHACAFRYGIPSGSQTASLVQGTSASKLVVAMVIK
jgi:hypothetical protein